MRLLPRTLAAKGELENKIHPPEVLHRYEVFIEREAVTYVSGVQQSYTHHCEICGRDVVMVVPELAAEMAATTGRNIYRWVEEKRIHFLEPSAGVLLICTESLKAHCPAMQASCDSLSELSTPNLPQLPGSTR